jgi:DNA-binding beta-propeller fold protein YncE
MDLNDGRILKTVEEPFSEHAKAVYPKPDDYPHNSAHHGLALSGDGTRLCDAGTIDDTVSIVSTEDLTIRSTIAVGSIPYWATTSEDGKYCFVSLSGEDAVSVIDFESGEQVGHVKVGRFPQRSRLVRLSALSRANFGLTSPSRD